MEEHKKIVKKEVCNFERRLFWAHFHVYFFSCSDMYNSSLHLCKTFKSHLVHLLEEDVVEGESE
jgi:hypothetical protein